MAPQAYLVKLFLVLLNLQATSSFVRADDEGTRYSFPIVGKSVEGSTYELHDREDVYIADKYGLDHSRLVRRAGPGGSATTVPIQDNFRYLIYMNITGQFVAVEPDLGSAKFWVPDPSIAGGNPAPNSWKNPNNSSGSCVSNSAWNITYADGRSFSGPICLADVRYPSNGATAGATSTWVFLATKGPSNNQDSGILGLAKDPYAGAQIAGRDFNVPTFFQNIIPNLPQPVFTMDYKLKKNGTIDFGFIDDSKHTGPITYTARSANTVNWGMEAIGYNISNNGGSNSTRSIPFGLDSGVSRIFMPPDIVTQYHKAIPGATNASGGWDYPCSQTPPDLTLGICGQSYTIPGRYMLYGPRPQNDGFCTSNLQNTPFGGSLFGTPFLRTVFAVFLNSSSTYPYGAIGLAKKNLN